MSRLRNAFGSKTRAIAAVLYLAAVLGVIALADADSGAGLPVWVAVSFCLGWVTRSPWSALLPLLAVPLAVPFGYPEEWTSYGGHDPLPLWFGALAAAPWSAAIVLAGVGGRHLYEHFRASRT